MHGASSLDDGDDDTLKPPMCPLCDGAIGESRCAEHGIRTFSAGLQSTGKDIRVGSLVDGRYRLEKVLGTGAMGAVYLATQLAMGRAVAVKVIRPEVLDKVKSVKRFFREASALSAITHPNVVRIFDFGVDAETQSPFLVLELVKGRTLEAVAQKEGPFDERRARSLMLQAARPLAEMHEIGLVHRDLKPDNIMVETLADGSDHLRLLDFGLTKILTSHARGAERLTATGVALGTPAYMSPEQASASDVDGRADLYSLGCILHRLLTGAPPYLGESLMDIMFKHVSAPIPSLPERLSDGRAPSEELKKLHTALLAKETSDRPAGAHQVAQILSAVPAQPRAPVAAVRGSSRWGLAIPVVAGAAIALGLLALGLLVIALRGEDAPLSTVIASPIAPPIASPTASLASPAPSASPEVTPEPAAPRASPRRSPAAKAKDPFTAW